MGISSTSFVLFVVFVVFVVFVLKKTPRTRRTQRELSMEHDYSQLLFARLVFSPFSFLHALLLD